MDTNQETKVMEPVRDPKQTGDTPVSSIEQELKNTSEKLSENMGGIQKQEIVDTDTRIVDVKSIEEESSESNSEENPEPNEESDSEPEPEPADSEVEKKKQKKNRKENPIKSFRKKINDESIDDETAKTMVNIIGIVGGLAFILVAVLIAVFFYGQFSSFSSQYNQKMHSSQSK